MPPGGRGRPGTPITDVAIADFFSRRDSSQPAMPPAGGGLVSTQPTKILPRFVSGLAGASKPVLLDLGPVVGANVEFFGEELGCKIIVEDVATQLDEHTRNGTTDDLPAVLARRISHPDACIDGVLCWDLFDYLEKAAAESLAREVTRVLRPEGFLLALFNTAEPGKGARPQYTRHTVVDARTLEYRPYPAARARRRPLLNRDIQRLFDPLRVVDQFLLRANVREVLLRKPAVAPPASADASA